MLFGKLFQQINVWCVKISVNMIKVKAFWNEKKIAQRTHKAVESSGLRIIKKGGLN